MMMTSQIDAASAQKRLAPIVLSGFLEYNFEFEKFSAAEGASVEHIGRLRIDAATFIVQPWIAQVRGGLGFSLRDQQQSDEGRQGEFITADLNLRLFPSSRFPFEAFLLRSDDNLDTSGEGTLSGRDTERTRYGINQRYTSKRYGAFNFRFTHEDRLQDEIAAGGEPKLRQFSDTSDLLNFGYRKSFGRHRVDFRGDWNRVGRETRQDSDRLFTTLRHNYSAGAQLTVENRLTYDDQKLDDEIFTFSTQALEFNNITYWRPRTAKPLLINGFVRARTASTGSRQTGSVTGRSETKIQTGSANMGASYQWSERWRLLANTTAAVSDGENNRSTRKFARAGADYTSRDFPLGGFRYAYFFGPRLTYIDDQEVSAAGVGIDAGHSLHRTVVLDPRSNVIFNARQSAGFIEDGEGRSVQKLTHNFDIGWSHRGNRSVSMLRLSVSDNRTTGGGGRQGDEDSEFQIVNLQGSLDLALSRQSSLNGNITIQATRTDTPGVTTRDTSKLDPSAAINLTYLKRNMFNVRRLFFRSNLRLFSQSYFPQLDEPSDPTDREQTIWENRLDYQIGRLQLRLVGTLSRTQDLDRAFLLLQLRRFFGNF